MSFGRCPISPEELAELIRTEVLPMAGLLGARDRRKISDSALRAGRRRNRTKAIKIVLRRRATKLGFRCFPNSDKRLKKRFSEFLCDLTWWEDRSGKKGVELAVESEWNREPGAVVDDFEKLLVVKSPLKLMVYRVSRNTRERVRQALVQSIREYRHHVKSENYIFCEFQPGWKNCICLLFQVSKTGPLSKVKFQELRDVAAQEEVKGGSTYFRRY